VRNGNIEATALEVGYGSKKNFYRAFRRVTGLTLAAFRRLSHERAFQKYDDILGPQRTQRHREEHASGSSLDGAAQRRARRANGKRTTTGPWLGRSFAVARLTARPAVQAARVERSVSQCLRGLSKSIRRR